MTVMKLEVRANDFFAAIYAAFERSDQSVIRHTVSLPPRGSLSPVLREGGNPNPLHVSLRLNAKKKGRASPRRSSTHGDRSN